MRSKKRVTITEGELKKIIKESIVKVLQDKVIPNMIFSPVDMYSLDNPIVEGLIVSYSEDKVIPYISKTFSLCDNIEKYIKRINEYYGVIISMGSNNGTEVILCAVKKSGLRLCRQITRTMETLCGWNLACVVNETPQINSYDSWFANSHYILQFDKKFDDDVSELVFNKRFIYHVCPNSRLEKIKHIGLTPRSSTWKKFKHEDRVYFYLNKPSLKDITDEFEYGKSINSNGYSLLSIDTSLIDKDIKFYSDPRVRNAVVTTRNIPPQAIKVIE